MHSHKNLWQGLWLWALLFLIIFILHWPLLRLPYFWDEAGYYVPAARDLYLQGSLIPHSTESNAHPPLVMALLALGWKVGGFSPFVTRTVMLVITGFALLGLFRLAKLIANREVAIAATICSGLYPVFFAQSSLAHVDMAAAGFCYWGLESYFGGRFRRAAGWFTLAVLSKETALLVPLTVLCWGLASRYLFRRDESRSLWLLLPLLILGFWYAYHFHVTGYVFGNPEFFRYNVRATWSATRFLLAFLLRVWHCVGYMNLYLLTIAMAAAMLLPPLVDKGQRRERIGLDIQLTLLAIVLVYAAAMAVVGGAVLARYMLPVVPLIIVVWVSTLWRRVRRWHLVVGVIALAFAAGWFQNPPYGFAPEDNLAYRDYIELHERAAQFLLTHSPETRVLTAWPGRDELSRPYLGYVDRPIKVIAIEDFSLEQVMGAADFRSNFDTVFAFSTKVEPLHPMFENWTQWQEWKKEYFGYHRDLPPAAIAQMLGGKLIYQEERNGQWVGVIEMEQLYEARR